MKYLVFVAVLLTIFPGIFIKAAAQKASTHSGPKNAKAPGNRPVRFIEGIEIKRESISSATTEAFVAKQAKISNDTIFTAIEKSNALHFKYAQLMNRNVEAVNNDSLFSFIDDWWQTKYSYGGNSKSGVDCSGFACLLFRGVYDVEIPRTTREAYNACEKIRREALIEGDLVFFNTRGGVSHVGIYLGEGYFVHASTSNGVTIDHLDGDYYSARFLGGGRLLRIESKGLAGTN